MRPEAGKAFCSITCILANVQLATQLPETLVSIPKEPSTTTASEKPKPTNEASKLQEGIKVAEQPNPIWTVKATSHVVTTAGQNVHCSAHVEGAMLATATAEIQQCAATCEPAKAPQASEPAHAPQASEPAHAPQASEPTHALQACEPSQALQAEASQDDVPDTLVLDPISNLEQDLEQEMLQQATDGERDALDRAQQAESRAQYLEGLLASLMAAQDDAGDVAKAQQIQSMLRRPGTADLNALASQLAAPVPAVHSSVPPNVPTQTTAAAAAADAINPAANAVSPVQSSVPPNVPTQTAAAGAAADAINPAANAVSPVQSSVPPNVPTQTAAAGAAAHAVGPVQSSVPPNAPTQTAAATAQAAHAVGPVQSSVPPNVSQTAAATAVATPLPEMGVKEEPEDSGHESGPDGYRREEREQSYKYLVDEIISKNKEAKASYMRYYRSIRAPS